MIVKLITVAIFIAILPSFLQAHAFDCLHANKDYEHLICKSRNLATADDNLNSIYKAALKHSIDPQKIKQEQRLWVSNAQSPCKTENCLNDAYAARTKNLIESYSSWCITNKNKFNDEWKGDGNGFFEELSTAPDGTFSSWLHQRPGISGTWKSKGCYFNLTSDSNDMVFNLVLLDINDSHMHVLAPREQGIAIYNRIKN